MQNTRLLAFGDSLTAGYHAMGNSFSPWAPVICKLLGVAKVDHIGFSGFTTKQLVDSLDEVEAMDLVQKEWPGLRYHMSRHKYSVVLIMAGTNDLADQMPTSEIVDNIAKLHGVAHSFGARTIALTMPESHAALSVGWLGRAREQANEAIRQWARKQPKEKVHLVEGATLVPFDRKSGLWEPDGLHMSKAGYMAFGNRLAPLIEEFVRAPYNASVSDGGGGDTAALSPSEEAAQRRGQADKMRALGWRVGAAVRVHGLVKAAHHNGRTGRLLSVPADDAARLGVALDGAEADAKPLSVKRENLQLMLEVPAAEQKSVLDVD